MKKYLINDDDTVRIGQTIFKIDQTKHTNLVLDDYSTE